VLSSPGAGSGIAVARQWRQARPQAFVSSQYTIIGADA
jgi:hypothetical protein